MVGADERNAGLPLTAEQAGQLVMMQIALVGLGAGAASAFLFASILSGTALSIILAYLAPLPIMIAAIGWSHWAGLVAALAAAVGLAAGFGNPLFMVSFLIATGLPAWWLGYLTLLGRPNAEGGMEWYPPGRLLLWCAAVSALMILIVVPTFGLNEESFRAGLQKFMEGALRERGTSASRPSDLSDDDIKRLVDSFITIMPPIAAGVSTLINVINLYLAARITKVSGRLRREWPDLSSIRFPAATHIVFALSLVIWFLPGAVGMAGGVIWATLTVAYGILGVAVLHAVTRSFGNRTFILATLYIVLALFWPAIVLLAFIGIADAIFDFRNRAGTGKPPALTQ